MFNVIRRVMPSCSFASAGAISAGWLSCFRSDEQRAGILPARQHRAADDFRLFKDVDPSGVAGRCRDNSNLCRIRRPDCWLFAGLEASGLAHWSKLGLAQVQDATAAGLSNKCESCRGQCVLDRCAGSAPRRCRFTSELRPSGYVVADRSIRVSHRSIAAIAGDREIANVKVVQVRTLSPIRPWKSLHI